MHNKRFYRLVLLVAIVELICLLIQSGIFKPYFVAPQFCSTFTNDTCLLDYEESAKSFIARYRSYCESRFSEGSRSRVHYKKDAPLCACVPDSIFSNITPTYHTCPDGFQCPVACVPRHKSVIIIPYRNRHYHLKVILKLFHILLRKQHLAYKIFVVEQEGEGVFNKAVLMNAGFLEIIKHSISHPISHPPSSKPHPPPSLNPHIPPHTFPHNQKSLRSTYQTFPKSQQTKFQQFQNVLNLNNNSNNNNLVNNNAFSPIDCFIFHDVDMLPVPPYVNMYVCVDLPRHVGVFQKKNKYILEYDVIFGGATGFKREHFEMVNGFSNSFYGWGGEDDDMLLRVKAQGLRVNRFPRTVARYEMISHSADQGNPENHNKNGAFSYSKDKYTDDGLNNIKYKLVKWEDVKDYTRLLVRVPPPPSNYQGYDRTYMFQSTIQKHMMYFLCFLISTTTIVLIIIRKMF